MASVVSSTGLGSGIDINGLVSKLVDAEQTPITQRLDKHELDVQTKLTAFGTFKSALSDFRSSLAGLSKLGQFNQLSATSSDPSMVTVSAGSNADLGNYRLEVKQLAQSQALASSVAYKTVNDPVGTGTLTIKFGTYATTASGASGTPATTTFTPNSDKGTLTLTLDSTNNSLTGLRDAINKANAGVSAAIIYNGTGYQLVLNSADGGARNAMQVTGIAGLQYTGGITAGDSLLETQTGQDAIASINGLEVTSTTNTISSALKGLTINLLKAEAANSQSIVNIGVSPGSSEDISKSLQAFIKSYNDLYGSVKSVASYDSANKTAGPLLGNAAVQGAMSSIRSQLLRPVAGLTGSIKSLVDIGLSTQSDGTLSLNSSKLNAALASDRKSVAAVFSVLGRPSDTGVQYVDSGSGTAAGTYAVKVTQAATQGTITGSAITGLSVATPLVITAGSNDAFSVNIDGAGSGTITLTAGSYTSGDALAAEVQSRINGSDALRKAGISAQVVVDASNHLVITSKSYGSTSKVSISANNAALGLDSGATSVDGVDIAGTIGGQAAEGKGQQLSATSGGGSGLKLLVTDNAVGDRGAITFTRGLMESLDKALSGILGTSGSVAARTSGLQKDLDQITADRTKLADRMSALQTRLLKQFIAMDSLVGNLQSTGSYLSQQLSNMPYSKTG